MEKLKLIEELNLEPIKFLLIDKNEGPGWTLTKADEIEQQYKAFLILNYKYPEKPIVPSKDIDVFWHYHILDTRKYTTDCNMIFGTYLHHFPYMGVRGKEDAKNLETAFEETINIFRKEFPEIVSDLKESRLCINENWPKITGVAALCIGEDWPKIDALELNKLKNINIRPVPQR